MYDTRLPRRPTDYFEGPARPLRGRLPRRQPPGRGWRGREAWARAETFRDYLSRVFAAGTTPNGVFGAKLMWGHLDHFVSYLRDLPERAGTPVPKMFDEVFPSLRYVRVLRRDKLRQSVSDEWVERYPRGEYAR